MNVCTNVGSKPPVCADKAEAPVFQVVIPKPLAAAEEAQATEGGHLARAARAEPVPTECHALGSLRNASWALIKAGRPELGLTLTYRGGDDCLKRGLGGESGSWVAVTRQTQLRLRCDPSDTADRASPAAMMQLSRRVRVVETEMCEYVVEWPTRLACPRTPRKATPAAQLKGALRQAGGRGGQGGGGLRWAGLLLGLLLLVQGVRHAAALGALWPLLSRGDARAWRLAAGLLVTPGVAPQGAQLRRSLSVGGSPRNPRISLDASHDY